MGEIMNSPNGVKQYAIFDIIFHHIKLNDRKYNPVLNLSTPIGDYRDIYGGGGGHIPGTDAVIVFYVDFLFPKYAIPLTNNNHMTGI